MLVAGTLDEVAWLLNIRGDDIPNCPLAVLYAVLERTDGGGGKAGAAARPVVFVEEGKLGAEARRHLVDDCGAEVRAWVGMMQDACGRLWGLLIGLVVGDSRLVALLLHHPHTHPDSNSPTQKYNNRSGRTGTSLPTSRPPSRAGSACGSTRTRATTRWCRCV